MNFASNRARCVPWSGIRKMFSLAAQVPDAVNLSLGQPDFDTPAHVVEAAQRALDEGDTQYTPGLGIAALREAIAAKVWGENNIQADPEREIIVTMGAMEGIYLALLAVVDAGDEVIIGDPTYANYDAQILLVGGQPRRVAAPESNGFKMHPDWIGSAVTGRTKLLMINSPANPTGSVLSKADLQAIADLAEHQDLLVLSDEPYEKFVYDDVEHVSLASLPGMKERTISVFSFSKTYSMTGWRLGYVVAPPRVIDEMQKMQEDVAACVPGFVQQAGVAALTGSQQCVVRMLEEYELRRRYIVKALDEIDGLTCPKPKGAFYAFPNCTYFGRLSEEVAEFLLKESGVVCVPGTAFGPAGEGHLRISYAASMEQLEEGVDRIRKGIEELRRASA